MRPALGVAVAAIAAAAWAAPARAQDSVFGIRGLGFPDLGVAARSAGLGAANAVFDGESTVNPAALGGWTGTAGWGVASSSSRSFDPGTGAVSLTSTRFPLFGFASEVGPRLVVAVTASDYLDRNWNVAQADTVKPRDSSLVVNDQTRSQGGVTDLRFAAAYRLPGIAFGFGVHLLTGSALTNVLRQFPSDSAYLPFTVQSTTSYRGVGASFGVVAAPVSSVVLGASVRFSGRLRAESPDTTVDVPMPVEMNAGLTYQPVTGLVLATTVGHATWSRASAALVSVGQVGARDVWNVGAGADVALLRVGRSLVPLRIGYRWRQLPFPIPAADSGAAPLLLSEHATSVGFGFTAAGGRATVDVAFEWGSRVAGPLRETFTNTLLGLTVRP